MFFFKTKRDKTKLIMILRKSFLIAIMILSWVTAFTQQSACVLGLIENPIPAFVSLSYTKNYFTLEKGTMEMPLDSNNTFAFKVNLNEPQEFTFNYFTHSIRLFLSPNDTLKLVFNGQNIGATIYCEGNTAVQNKFLIDFQLKFPDWNDESAILDALKTKSVDDYQNYINQIYTEKQNFIEKYDPSVKKQFSKVFNAFFQQNLTYSRAYHLLNYFKQNGWIKTDNIPSSVFAFMKDSKVNDDNALLNDFYLRYLELYLDFERYNVIKKKPYPVAQDVVLEKSRKIQTFYRSLSSHLPLFQNPFLSDSIITYLTFRDELQYLNMASETRIRVESKNMLYDDVFLNVKTAGGQIGWIQQTLAQPVEKLVIEKEIYRRQCLDEKQPLCDFDRFLTGKVLMHAAARDIILGILEDTYDQAQSRMQAFFALNKNYKKYNFLLQTVFDSTMALCQKGETRPIIPSDITVEKLSGYDKILRGAYERFSRNKEDNKSDEIAQNVTAGYSKNIHKGENILNNNQNYIAWDALNQYQPDNKPAVFKGLALNENMPSFVVTDSKGKEIRQQSLLGKVVYLVFWATWCSPCQTHMTYSQSLIDKYQDKDITFIYVSIDDEAAAWKQYISDNKLKGIHVNDAVIMPINCKIQGLPNFLIIDKNGHIAYNSLIQSKVSEEEMLDFLLKDKKN
jgi:thiol-disulfide isomerase/thioredoxin